MRRVTLVLALVAASPSLPAQVSVVVPPEYESVDAVGMGEFAGLSQAFRQQIVVNSDTLRELRGRSLTSLWVRRDVGLPVPLRGGKAQIAVTLSDGARHPSTVVATFATNCGPQPVQVFAGVIDVPTAPAPPMQGPRPVTWTSPTAIEIRFATEFTYRGGHLCVEIEGRPVAGQQAPSWPVDQASWAHDGTMAMAGRTCDPRVQAMAVWPILVPGARMTLFASGPTLTTAVCLIGRQVDPPTDFKAQRAPQCQVHIDPFDARAFAFPRVREAITRLEQPLPVPAMACFLGAHIAIQWLNLPNLTNPTGIVTTHVQVLKLAQSLLVFPGATVRSGPVPGATFPDRGEVQVQQMPVLRFVAR